MISYFDLPRSTKPRAEVIGVEADKWLEEVLTVGVRNAALPPQEIVVAMRVLDATDLPMFPNLDTFAFFGFERGDGGKLTVVYERTGATYRGALVLSYGADCAELEAIADMSFEELRQWVVTVLGIYHPRTSYDFDPVDKWCRVSNAGMN